MGNYLRVLLVLLCMYYTVPGLAQENRSDSINSQKVGIVPLPVLFFLPETGWAYGAASVFTVNLDPYSKPSQWQLAFAYTQQNQMLFYLPFDLLMDSSRWRFSGELGYYRYSYRFYGVGSHSRQEDQEIYNVIYPRLRFQSVYGKRRFFAGVRVEWDQYDITGVADGGILDADPIPGRKGGAFLSIGPALVYDTRDDVMFPYEGTYAVGNFLVNPDGWVGPYSFNKWIIDARHYLPVGKKGRILAMQWYSEGVEGNVPFYQMAGIGGRQRLRGLIQNRFVDRNAVTGQLEWRHMVFSRLGYTIFAGTGQVGQGWLQAMRGTWKTTLGGGLRFRVRSDRRLNIRVDAGYSPEEGTQFYFTFGEAF